MKAVLWCLLAATIAPAEGRVQTGSNGGLRLHGQFNTTAGRITVRGRPGAVLNSSASSIVVLPKSEPLSSESKPVVQHGGQDEGPVLKPASAARNRQAEDATISGVPASSDLSRPSSDTSNQDSKKNNDGKESAQVEEIGAITQDDGFSGLANAAVRSKIKHQQKMAKMFIRGTETLQHTFEKMSTFQRIEILAKAIIISWFCFIIFMAYALTPSPEEEARYQVERVFKDAVDIIRQYEGPPRVLEGSADNQEDEGSNESHEFLPSRIFTPGTHLDESAVMNSVILGYYA
mmetsp:Transcript_26277/g.46599  ORF Transcript_26277/g.46599 Transcript_26277/m.46599 type:complete len:290 (+) Transcript_26277:50-919(+)